MTDFAQTLAEKCARVNKDECGEEFVHLRDRAGVAVLSVSPRAVHCPAGMALELVRKAVAGFVEEGIEEGRRQAGATVLEAHEEGRRAGWAEAFVAVAGEATRLREAATLARDAAERARLDWIAAERVQEALAAAMPEGGAS